MRARFAKLVGLTTLSFGGLSLMGSPLIAAQSVVPGTGTKIEVAGDDFEDDQWTWYPQNPKSSEEDDKKSRLPAGFSGNQRWFEGIKRGHPDVVKRIETPPNGLAGSNGSLLLQTLQSGIPGRLSHRQMQDDFVANVVGPMRGFIPVSRKPSAVCRVYFPPFEQWEQRSGNSFGFRLACRGVPTRETNSEFKNDDGTETYWPGFFVWHTAANPQRKTEESAHFILRGGPIGQELRGPTISRDQLGWWTLGLSCSPDGAVHYYAKPGIDDLTAQDWVSSQHPYGYRCTHFETFFFNIINQDDGRSWSTPWVIDDSSVYYNGPAMKPAPAPQVAAPGAIKRAPQKAAMRSR